MDVSTPGVHTVVNAPCKPVHAHTPLLGPVKPSPLLFSQCWEGWAMGRPLPTTGLSKGWTLSRGLMNRTPKRKKVHRWWGLS